ncbi:hypothetical protein [Desulfosoma caldarium]|uniref:Uncharacterized protein n=1 Tax=Desulfosoma caldarium TaxID=610254 RepID=A0A3N1UFN5_9BACT|nr:hypothetical protein [Desulfosoma caldarium]ROQ90142.1 hypothetical protein EDC27_2754 [Desulfosoma caldarium]
MAESSLSVNENELRHWIAPHVTEVLRDKADALFYEKIAAFVSKNEPRARELALRKKVGRMEEEIKALPEIHMAHFNAAEKAL